MDSSELAQRVGINEVAESMMAFNTNYKDTGLFGVYAVAKVNYHVVFGLFLLKLIKLGSSLICNAQLHVYMCVLIFSLKPEDNKSNIFL